MCACLVFCLSLHSILIGAAVGPEGAWTHLTPLARYSPSFELRLAHAIRVSSTRRDIHLVTRVGLAEGKA